MAISNQLLPISSTCKFFVLLTITLLLVNAHVVNAQDNTNGTNSNTSNTNINANRNSNGNTSTTANTNANQNGNTNRNVNGNSNQRGSGASETPTPDPTPDPRVESRRDLLTNSYWFFTIVTLMFGVVLIPFALTIVRAIRFSSATYNSPLGLPEGSLRAILAYTLVAFLGFYILASILSISYFNPPEFLLGIVATVIGFYFGSRAGEGGGTATQRIGTVEGNVTDKTGAPAGGANVELTQSDGKKLMQKADADGKYKFDNVPVGDHVIQASSTGHAPSDEAKVKVTAGAAQTVNLTLK